MTSAGELTTLGRVVRRLGNTWVDVAERTRGLIRRTARAGMVSGGRGLRLGRGVEFRLYGRLSLGDGVRIRTGAVLEVGPSASLNIGPGCWVGVGSVVAASESVTIGSRVLIGEHCTVRDGDHHIDRALREIEESLVSSPVVIGDGVWIGAGARVLRGTQIGDGAVVGANAVVRAQVPPNVVVVGIPARIVGDAQLRHTDQ